jgi:molybdate transport system substrate-binding protein
MRYRLLLALLLFASAASATAKEEPPTRTAVRVVVPGGLVGPFSEIAPKFEASHPAIRLQWDRDNMVTIVEDVLADKIQPDVFLSLGDTETTLLRRAGRILPSTRREIVPNSLALLAPKGNPADLHSLQDLAGPRVTKIAVPDPKLNSAGAHALEAFRRAGLWESVEPKVVFVKYVARAQELARQARVEAAIVYYACAFEVYESGEPPQAPRGVDLVARLSPRLHEPFSREAVVLKRSPHRAEAEALLTFLAGPEAAPIWRKWRFSSPLSKAGSPA